MKSIEFISNNLYKLEKVVAGILCTILLVSLAGGVLFRYVLEMPLFWSDELALFCLAWITFIGGSMGLKQKLSPSITILTDSVAPKIRKMINILANLILLVFIIYILYVSIVWITGPTISVQKSTALQWPKLYFYLSIPVSFTFMAIHVLELFLKSFTHDGEEKSEEVSLQ